AAELATACDETLAEAWMLLGAACAKQKKVAEAAAAYDRALALAPDDITTLADAGEAHIQLMNYQKAAAYLQRAMTLDPNAQHASGRRARAVVGRTIALLRSS